MISLDFYNRYLPICVIIWNRRILPLNELLKITAKILPFIDWFSRIPMDLQLNMIGSLECCTEPESNATGSFVFLNGSFIPVRLKVKLHAKSVHHLTVECGKINSHGNLECRKLFHYLKFLITLPKDQTLVSIFHSTRAVIAVGLF